MEASISSDQYKPTKALRIGDGIMSRTYKPFSGPFAPMLTEFLAQKRAIGYQYLAGYWVLRKFDSFSMDYDVVDYALTKVLICLVLRIEKSCCDKNKTCFGGSTLHTFIEQKNLKFLMMLVEKFSLK